MRITLHHFILLSLTMAVAGCSTFESADDKPLEGERISVLELQKSLEAEAPVLEENVIEIPPAWRNEFWPQAGGYPNHSMQNLELSNELKTFWRADIGKGNSKGLPLTAQPVVVDGRVFTLDTESMLSAFNVNNGNMLWRQDVSSEQEDEPVIGGGIAFSAGALYVTNGFNEILSVNPANGDVLWRKKLPAPARAAPTIIDRRAYVTLLDNRILSLDATNGEALWEYRGLGEIAGLLGAASPGANRDIVVPVFSSGEITALRVENGSVAWSDNLSSLRNFGGLASLSDIRGLPVLDRGLVFAISFGGRLVAIDERTGARIWQREIGGSQTPWVAGENVFVASSDNQLVALGRENGVIRWVTDLPRYEDPEDSDKPITWIGPILAGNRLIVIGTDGHIIETNPENGQVIREWQVNEGGFSIPPLVAGGVLYVLTQNGQLLAYK